MRFLLFCLLLTNISHAIASNRAVHYEPEIVELSGTVKLFTGKGIPDYEKDNLNETVAKWGYIKLDKRINITPCEGSKNTENMPQQNINIIRLISNHEKHWQKIRTGNHVHITGALSYSSAGIGQPRVLLNIRQINVCGRKAKLGTWHYKDADQDFIIK